jgi:hypothetical protein
MGSMYVAVVKTTGATYRATAPTPNAIAITEDGVDGVIDYIHLTAEQAAAAAPENLTATLTWWVYEFARGMDIISATLSIHN